MSLLILLSPLKVLYQKNSENNEYFDKNAKTW